MVSEWMQRIYQRCGHQWANITALTCASASREARLIVAWAPAYMATNDLIYHTYVDEEGRPIEGVKVEVRDRTADRFSCINPEEPGRRPVRSFTTAKQPARNRSDSRVSSSLSL